MRPGRGGQWASRVILAVALAVTTAGAAAVATADPGPGPALPDVPAQVPVADPVDVVANYSDVDELVLPEGVPAPADVVRETGSWFSHGRTLVLRPDGSGTFESWIGAFDGDRISLRLIPAPGEATVAEIVAIEPFGEGALAPEARPGVGGLVTVTFGTGIRTAHLEWTSGADRHSVDLCPAEGLDAAAMEALRCGA